MQVQTLTITTEAETIGNVNFQITTFEQTITVFCDCCPNQQSGTKTQLERQGWSIGRNAEFCPNCNF
jgi:hypothetical protein